MATAAGESGGASCAGATGSRGWKNSGRKLLEESPGVPADRSGAGNRIRTGDPQLGKLMLYQLSYSRVAASDLPETRPAVKTKRGGRASPDAAAILADHGLTGLADEGLGELRHVDHQPVDATARRRVRVGHRPGARFSGRSFSQAHCAKPTKKRCSGVRPSRGSSFWPAVAAFQATYARIVPAEVGDVFAEVSLPLILMSSTMV